MLWLIFAGMLALAAVAVVRPLASAEGGVRPRGMAIGAGVMALSVVLYLQIGSPDARNETAAPQDIEAMVNSLAERLERFPEDADGWKMLGRSYRVMGRFEDAVAAFERAVELEDSADGQTLADLGEALFLADNRNLDGRAGALFDNALALVPGNPKALFYSGLAAAGRGDTELAAARWEALLATSPPPEVAETLRTNIAAWRGEAPPPPEAAADGPTLDVDVTVGDAVPALGPDTSVFVIARSPDAAGPPIAVERRQFKELPTRVTLDDADAMLPGRTLAGLESVEVVVRASPGGQPVAQSGDWFGSAMVDPRSAEPVSVEMNRQVP